MTSTQFPSPSTSYPLSFQSTAASLPSFFARRPLVSITCSLFSENTRVGVSSSSVPQCICGNSDLSPPAKGCKGTHTATLTTFRINTCKSVSKQMTLTICRMNTCEKQGEGGRSLYRFQAGLAFLLGARFADPHHTAAHGAERVLVQDQFDLLPAPQSEISVQPEPALRGIHHQTGNSRLVSFEVDDQAGALLRRNPPQAASFGNRKAGHLRLSGLVKDKYAWLHGKTSDICST